jgi:hypothetical protein
MIKLDIINPRNNARSSIELQLGELVIKRAKTDLAVSEFVSELARDQIPPGFMLLGSNGFRTP